MSKKAKLIASKYGFSCFLIFAEVFSIVAIFMVLSKYTSALLFVAFLSSFVAYLSIINRNTNPENKIPWVSIVLLLQPLGALLYVMFYEYKPSKRDIRHGMSLLQTVQQGGGGLEPADLETLDTLATGKARSILHSAPTASLYTGTVAEYFPLGEEMFQRMLEDLRAAERFIFMEYFIIEDGIMWRQILNILTEKAAAGVEVRLMYDDIGCMATLPKSYDRQLRGVGIQCRRFNRFLPVASSIHNNRDHRKILVVDGQAGYTGGINLADEYINQVEKFGHWKDGGIRLEGSAVQGLTRLFLLGWDLNLKTISDYDWYCACTRAVSGGNGCYLPFGCGPSPVYERPVGKNVLLNLFNQASSYVYVTTPYLIIDYDLSTAIENAALRGVDVRIITPYVPDKKFVQLMTRNSYAPLLNAGVKIFEYEPGFIHAKNVISDDTYALVGTINFDYRSLAHHYEDAVWMYRPDILPDIKADFLETQGRSIEIKAGMVRETFWQRVLRSYIRLFTPIL